MPHARGGVVCDSHSTVIESAYPVVQFLKDHSGVHKIVLGKISTIHGRRSCTKVVKIADIRCGLRLQVTQKKSTQELLVHTRTGQAVKEALVAFVTGQGYDVRHAQMSQ